MVYFDVIGLFAVHYGLGTAALIHTSLALILLCLTCINMFYQQLYSVSDLFTALAVPATVGMLATGTVLTLFYALIGKTLMWDSLFTRYR